MYKLCSAFISSIIAISAQLASSTSGKTAHAAWASMPVRQDCQVGWLPGGAHVDLHLISALASPAKMRPNAIDLRHGKKTQLKPRSMPCIKRLIEWHCIGRRDPSVHRAMVGFGTVHFLRNNTTQQGRVDELTNSRTMKSKLLMMNGHLRPYRSLAIPNAMDPTDRNMRTRVMPHVISVAVLPNSLARSLTVRETVKKSKASHVYHTRTS